MDDKTVLLTLLNSEIMKAQFHYGNSHPYVKQLYRIRTKILKG